MLPPAYYRGVRVAILGATGQVGTVMRTLLAERRFPLDDVRFHDPAAFKKLLAESTGAMREIPGVQHAAVGLSLPYERAMVNGALVISDGREAGQHVETNEVYITPGYFETLQIPVLIGRSFTEQDGPNSQRVAIVNRIVRRHGLIT